MYKIDSSESKSSLDLVFEKVVEDFGQVEKSQKSQLEELLDQAKKVAKSQGLRLGKNGVQNMIKENKDFLAYFNHQRTQDLQQNFENLSMKFFLKYPQNKEFDTYMAQLTVLLTQFDSKKIDDLKKILEIQILLFLTTYIFMKYFDENQNDNISQSEFVKTFQDCLKQLKYTDLKETAIKNAYNIMQVLSRKNLKDFVIYSDGGMKGIGDLGLLDDKTNEQYLQLMKKMGNTGKSILENIDKKAYKIVDQFHSGEKVSKENFYFSKELSGENDNEYFYPLLFGNYKLTNLEYKDYNKIMTRHAYVGNYTPKAQGVFDERFLGVGEKKLNNLIKTAHNIVNTLDINTSISPVACGLQLRVLNESKENEIQDKKYYAIVPGNLLKCDQKNPIGYSQKGTKKEIANNLCLVYEPTSGELVSAYPVTDQTRENMSQKFNEMTLERISYNPLSPEDKKILQNSNTQKSVADVFRQK